MPTYEYRCKTCGHELEAVQAFSDDPLTACPACGGDLRKKFSAVGISFKGSGFYKTDSRSSSSSRSATSSRNGSDGSSSSSSSTGSDGSSSSSSSSDGSSSSDSSTKGESSSPSDSGKTSAKA